jgi:hypothetical protein
LKNFYQSPFSKYLCGIVVAILKMVTARNFSMSGIYWGHHNLPTNEMSDRHFQNGRHNTAKIQHCPISSKFDMWVDYDVPRQLEIVQCRESIRDIIIYPHMKCR